MGLTKQYLRYEHIGSFNAVGSANGAVVAIDSNTCAVTACENVNFYNFRTGDKASSFSESTKPATCIKISHNKKFMAVGYADGSIKLIDRTAIDQSQSIVFCGHKKGVNCLAFSHDDLFLASGGKDSSIVLWDIVGESGLYRLNGHKESVTHLEFTRNGRFLISSCKDTFIKFWELQSQSCFYTLTESRSEIYSFLLLRDESLLVVATTELELYIFAITWLNHEVTAESLKQSDPMLKKMKEVESNELAFIGDCENKFVRVSLRGKVLRQCKGRALQLAASPDEQFIASLGSDKLVDFFRLYSEDEAQKRLTKKLRKAKRKAADSGNEEPNVEDVRRDISVMIARIGEWRAPAKPKWIDFSSTIRKSDNSSEVTYRAFCLFVNNSTHCLDIALDVASNEVSVNPVAELDRLGHREDVRSMSVASHNALLVTGGGSQVLLWNAETFRPVNTLSEEGMDDVTAVLFATGDRHILAATKSGLIFVFDVASCECLEKRECHSGPIWSLVRHPDGTGFVSASSDKTIKFWNYDLVAEGSEKRLTIREKRILELQDEALSAAISPNGKFLVVGLLDMTAAIFFMDTLKFYLSLYGHSLPVTCCTVSPDSKLVVTGSVDKSIKIWGLDFGDCHKSFHAHDDVVSSVMFSPSEEMLVWSAGRDGKIRQWDTVKFERVQTLERHSAEVRCMAQTSNGSILFTASHDRSVRAWELTEEIIVLQEEEEIEREKQYEEKLAEDEDVVPGEAPDGEASIAERKSQQTIIATENIIDAIDIIRKDRMEKFDNPEYTPHPLYVAYRSKSLDHFLVDVIARIRPSHLERCLLLLPLAYVIDVLHCLTECAKLRYKVELASRVALFLIKIHHSHVINNVEMVPVVERLRLSLMGSVKKIRDTTHFNLSALQLLATEIEERQEVHIFTDLSKLESKKKKKKAIVKTVH